MIPIALTKEQLQQQLDILDATGGHRETARRQRVVPENYSANTALCNLEEMTLTVPGLNPVRVIVTRPKNPMENAPLHVNFHGGGFVFLQDQDDDLYCAHLAAATGAVVVDVDYASSIDAPFPMAFDQSYAVTKWAYEHCQEWGCDPNRFSVGGASAGGNLAMVVSMKAVQTGDFPLCLQILDYAANDNDMAMHDPKHLRSQAFSTMYVGGELEKLKDPFVSPCFAPDEMLKGLPKTLVIAPGKCPFFVCNNILAKRMEAQGVSVTVKEYPDDVHGFTVRMSGNWVSAQEDIIQAILAAGK